MGIAAYSIDFVKENIPSKFNFRGSQKPDDPMLGDIYTDTKTGTTYVFTGQSWEPFGNNFREPIRAISKTRCSTCGAILPIKDTDSNGLCECKYCRNIEYIWE